MENKQKVNKSKTFIDSMKIINFRSFHENSISLGRNLTMISGINGVGKSTVLGILAQICSFRENYTPKTPTGDEKLDSYKTVYGTKFESLFKDHFKISSTYDEPSNEYEVEFNINDAGEEKYTSAKLKGTRRLDELRFVLRKTESIGTNTSRNITFPTIYLSLKRLTPYVIRSQKLVNNIFSDEENKIFKKMNRGIFVPVTQKTEKQNITSNEGTVNSSVLTGDNYDIESASTGEDNLGQILASLISFERLKKNWSNYKGGLLLIDEIDAGLFPRAQSRLIKTLNNFSSRYNVQVVFTTHSPIIISKMIELKEQSELNKKTCNNIGLNFITNFTGEIQNQTNLSFEEMVAHLEVRRVSKQKIPKIHCYCEDSEAYVFLDMLLRPEQKKKVKFMRNIKIGGDSLKSLVDNKIPEFSKLSLIVLDGDKRKPKNHDNVLNLPSPTPPDQLMYKILSDEEASSDYWKKNSSEWTKELLINADDYSKIHDSVEFKNDCYKYTDDATMPSHLRELFKNWFNNNYAILKQKKFNPVYQIWNHDHDDSINKFRTEFDKKYEKVFSNYNYLS